LANPEIRTAQIVTSDISSPSHTTQIAVQPEKQRGEQTPLARDTATQNTDITLTNKCVENGYDKHYCLCITHIFKHALTVREYKAAMHLYTAQSHKNPSALMGAKLTLSRQNYDPREILAIDAMQRQLTDDPGFENRCQTATRFFASQAP